MGKPTIEQLEQKLKAKHLIEAQKEKGDKSYTRMLLLAKLDAFPPPKGLLHRHCPLCRARIKMEYISGYKYWECRCGYEYALFDDYDCS